MAKRTTETSYKTMLFRFAKTFFDTSTIHGFQHISYPHRHPFERLLWLLLVAAAAYGASVLSGLTITRYAENPTVISMERDRFAWNTTFPPVTVCPSSQYDAAKLDEHIERRQDLVNKSLYKAFVKSLAETNYLNLDSVVEYNGVSSDEYVELIRRFSVKLDVEVTNSAYKGRFLNVQETFTEMGICYSFNSALAAYNSFDYWKNRSRNLLLESELFQVNPLDGEVFVSFINISTGYKVFFHGPYEMIDVASKHLDVSGNKFVQIYLSALTIFSSERTKRLDAKQRKCRFYYESNLPHFSVYSYAACRMECRINLAKKLCGCLPHFYRPLEGEKVCNTTGLRCLSKFIKKLIFLKRRCHCASNCDETTYVVKASDERRWFLGSTLQWGIRDYPDMRLKRDVIFGFSDLLVYIGGMAGLFLGCSVLSFIEIAYFFTLRLFWYIKHFKNK